MLDLLTPTEWVIASWGLVAVMWAVTAVYMMITE